MISYRFVPISSQKGVLFFETPGRKTVLGSALECQDLTDFLLDSEIFEISESFHTCDGLATSLSRGKNGRRKKSERDL